MRAPRLAVAVALALAGPATAASPPKDLQAARLGAAWLAGQPGMPPGQQADAIVALAAARRPAAELRSGLRGLVETGPAYARTAGAAGKVVLAAVAAGANPRRLGGVDYLARIRSQYAAGRYGATSFDQALAMLATDAAGARVPAAAVGALRATQGAGGWGLGLRRRDPDDVSSTGLLIEALRAAGVPPRDPMLRRAATWMLAQRNAQGGYAFDGRAAATEANSTAIAIEALRALGRSPSPATRAALRALQGPDGAFAFTATSRGSPLLATTDSVVALSGTWLGARLAASREKAVGSPM